MSRVSEWMRLDVQMRLDIGKGDEARAGHSGLVLTHFGPDGNITDQIGLAPDKAMKLARWILDTFADPSPVGSGDSVAVPGDPQGASRPNP